MKVFISWSGQKSRAAAQALREWLPEIFDAVRPWMSEYDIKAGAQWYEELREALAGTRYCIVCLDYQSLSSPWVLFEVGYAARELPRSICPYLLDLTQLDILPTPFAVYQAKPATKEGTLDMVRGINDSVDGGLLEDGRLRRKFEREWPWLEERLRQQLPPPLLPPTLIARDRGQSGFRMQLFNTWIYPRKGHVVHDWEPIYKETGIPPDELVVRDAQGNELPAQVDPFAPADPTPAALVFSLLSEIPPVREDRTTASSFVTLERGRPTRSEEHLPQLRAGGRDGAGGRVVLRNNRLEIRFELQPEPFDDGRGWYAGAVTKVLLDGQEILDAFREQVEWMGEDVEKRCMQLDHLQLLSRNSKEIAHEPCDLIRSPYEIVSGFAGPARAVVTVASRRFSYRPGGARAREGDRREFRLYRVISLYRGVNYVTEELGVYGSPGARSKGQRPVSLGFRTRYFSYMDMGPDQDIVPGQEPKWFAVGSNEWSPFPGYGFASEADLSPTSETDPSLVANPHPDFPQEGHASKTYSWKLSAPPGKALRCLHLFTRGTTWVPETQRVWEEVISKPLIARFQP